MSGLSSHRVPLVRDKTRFWNLSSHLTAIFERERERERETERDRERQTEKETDRKRDRNIGRGGILWSGFNE